MRSHTCVSVVACVARKLHGEYPEDYLKFRFPR